MRILVDYRPALRARTGVGEYMHELVRAYTRTHRDEVSVFSSSWKDRPSREAVAELGAAVVDRRVPVSVLNYAWHRWQWPPVETLAGRFDVVHAAHPLLIPARGAAQVITIHDLFFLSNPDRTHAEIRRDYAALAPDHARRADAIITPSFYTRSLVTARFGVPDARIYACPPGAPVWQSLGRGPNVPSDGYILFVGTLEPRKNIGVLLDAYARAAGARSGFPRLVMAGGTTGASDEWLRRLAAPPLKGRVERIGYVAHDGRERLYAGARALILPSLDEGFGLPVLEAMSAGVPVIASNRGALPEVAGGAAMLVDPGDVDGFAAALEQLTADDAFARSRAEAGLARARAFTWEGSAARLRQAYTDAVDRRGRR